MEYLIALKIRFDQATAKISDVCSRRSVRHLLLAIKWLAFAFILYDFYIYGNSIGNPSLFIAVAAIFISSILVKTSKPAVFPEPDSKAGMKKHCEKCGVKVNINYGNAYQTLCEKCT